MLLQEIFPGVPCEVLAGISLGIPPEVSSEDSSRSALWRFLQESALGIHPKAPFGDSFMSSLLGYLQELPQRNHLGIPANVISEVFSGDSSRISI